MAAAARSVLLALVLFQLWTSALAWSLDGHVIICNLARPLLTPATMKQVDNLLNSDFKHNFSTLCTWGDEVQYLPGYSWSPPLHVINTPDKLCSYDYNRDCKGVFGQPNDCSSGAIKNYTSQLVDTTSQYNRSEALLFLSNIMGDIHQPLRVGFAGDGGGQFIRVWWLNTQNGSSTDLFYVWDSGILHEAYERYFNESTPTYNETLVDILGNMSLSIYANISAADVAEWSPCPAGSPSCPDLYAAESIQNACQWAYAGVTPSQILSEDYFASRLPIVEKRLRQAAVRLAATLNRIFDPAYISPPLVSPPGGPVLAPSLSPLPSAPAVPSVPTAVSPSLPVPDPPMVAPVPTAGSGPGRFPFLLFCRF